MLNCKEVTRRLSAAQDRELSLAERLQLKMHLAMCGGLQELQPADGFTARCVQTLHR
jgi:hypothetical protein